jgi:hypothetical protein
MSIFWSIDHSRRMVHGTAEGVLHLKDVEEYLDGMLQAATLSYCKMLDLSQCSSALSMEDVRSLAMRLNSFRTAGAMGPAAIVVGSHEVYEQVLAFGSMTAGKRPLKLFRESREAENWLFTEPLRTASLLDATDALPPPPR